jgi:hypothetical protein
MHNKFLTLPLSLTRLSERRRWDSLRPAPERRGGFAYHHVAAIVLATSVLYSIAIMFDLGVPSLRSFPVGLSTPAAVVMDLGLLMLAFAHFHFVQRPYAVLTGQQLMRPSATRTQDRLLVSALLLGFFFVWQPLPDLVWALRAPSHLLLMQAGWIAGWLSLVLSVALLEVPSFAQSLVRTGLLPCTCSATRVARAGIVCGLLLIEWCAAQMNIGHLLFAGALSGYLATTLFLYRRNVNAAPWRSSAMNNGLRMV